MKSIIFNSKLAKWWGVHVLGLRDTAAVTFPNSIRFVKSKEYWNERRTRFDEIVRHEACHLQQKARGGALLHYLKYFYYHLKYGHKGNPYEIEAREYAKRNKTV